MQKITASVLFLILTLFNSTVSAKIIETSDISDIHYSIEKNTLVLFDIDDTIMDAVIDLSSGGWIEYFWVTAHTHIPEKMEIVEKMMWHATLHIPVAPIDTYIPKLIVKLQNSADVLTLAFTARDGTLTDDTKENITALQLKTLGIDFSKSNFPKQFNAHSSFQQGIIFSASEPKGPHLKEVLKAADHLPAKIVFVDDKFRQVQSVDLAMAEMGIPCDCYWYRRAEQKRKDFDPILALIQYEYFICHDILLSNAEAGALKKFYTEKKPFEFLRELIEHYEMNYL